MSVIPTREQVPQIVPRRAGVERPPVGIAPAGQAAAPGGGITARDILRILRKRKWTIISFVVMFTAIAFVVTLLWRRFAPEYTAVAHLGVNPLQQDAFATGQVEFAEARVGGLKAAHAQMIGRESVLIRALDRQEVRNTAWYERDPERSVERLAEILSVAPARTANLISLLITEVAPREQDRIDLAEIANAMAQAYVDDVSAVASRGRANHIKRLRDKQAELQEQLDTIHADAKRKKLPEIVTMHWRMRTQGIKLENLENEGAKLAQRKAEIEASLKRWEMHAAAGTLGEMPEVRSMVENDPNIRALRDLEFDLSTRRTNLLKRVGLDHRLVMFVDTSLVAVRERLVEATTELLTVGAQPLKGHLLVELETVTAGLLNVKGQVARISEVVQVDLQRNYVEMKDMRSAEDAILGRLKMITDTLLQLELLAEADRPVWLRARATRPKTISVPKWTTTMPLGVLAGLALGLGLAFMLELMDTSIKGPADLASRVDLPILGMIPHADDLEEDFEQMPLAFMEHPNSPISEAHRQIRTRLLFSGPPSEQRSLLITSQLPGDGRTTVTMNLAHSIAQGGTRVLVVDANFHQPAIARLFPQCSDQGLSNVLVGQGDWRELAVEIEPNLAVLAAGPLPPNPAELLGSEQTGQTIAEMLQTYDQVLFDGPPCLVVADPVSLSTRVDGVVLVVRAGANTYGIVQKVRGMLLGVGAHLVGVVLNGVRVVAGGYLRKNYETFYEYREQAQLPSKQH